MTDLENYNAVRGQIEHEDNLITQRLSWLVASQSFLFTAFAIILNSPEISRLPIIALKQLQVFRLIPVVGFASGLLIYVSIFAGVLSMGRLRAHWGRHACTGRCIDLPPIQSPFFSRILGFVAPLLLPPVFMSIWLLLITSG